MKYRRQSCAKQTSTAFKPAAVKLSLKIYMWPDCGVNTERRNDAICKCAVKFDTRRYRCHSAGISCVIFFYGKRESLQNH